MGSSPASLVVAKCPPMGAALPAELDLTLPKPFECFADGMVKVKRRGDNYELVSRSAQVQSCLERYLLVKVDPINSPEYQQD